MEQQTNVYKTQAQVLEEQFHDFLVNKLKTDGYSEVESALYFEFEKYINNRLKSIETTLSMVANGIAIQKDTGDASLRELPINEAFFIQTETMGDRQVTREEFLNYLKSRSLEAVNTGVPVLSHEYDYLFKQAPSLNRVMKSSGSYPVELVAMILQKNTGYGNTDLLCLFETITGDVFSYRFRKNNKYDMFTPNYNSTFEVKDKANIGRQFVLKVAPSRTSGLLRIIDMETLNKQ